MDQSEPMPVVLRGVCRHFSAAGGEPVRILDGIDLAIEPGDSVAVVGPSGSGKSTLLNLMGGLDRPDAGSVRIGDQDLATLPEAALAALRNRCIGFVFQLHHLLPQCTALENVLLPTLARGSRAGADAMARARDLLDRVGLAGRRDAFPATLSGGERQRVAVARALINRPGLLLADEPTGSLDADSAADLADLLATLNREAGVSLVLVTHARDLAQRMARCLRLDHGRLQALEGGPP